MRPSEPYQNGLVVLDLPVARRGEGLPMFIESSVRIAGATIHMFKGGSGPPLILFHGAAGNRGPLVYARALAEHYTVYMPSHPGFNGSDRPEWLQTMPDLANFYSWFLEELDLEGSFAIGFSMGGWLAAEIATNCRHSFNKLVLVGAAGIQPKHSEITDIFLVSPARITELTFHNPQLVPEYDHLYGTPRSPENQYVAETNREMAVRLCWKPYMFNPSLPARLAHLHMPVKIIWGRQDRIIPFECGSLYQDAIPDSELVCIDECGHSPQIERPNEFVSHTMSFLI